MKTAPGEMPTKQEIERQLARMLASETFATRQRLSQMLKHIVGTTLSNGAKLDEHSIGFAVFENYDADSSAIRTNGTLLRAQIGRYYRQCAEDPVLIQVPAGGYRAVFSYNRQSPADKHYRKGWLYMNSFVPSQWEHASLALFRRAIETDPGHAAAHAATAEAELRDALYKRAFPGHDPLASAETSAREALRLQPSSWRAHGVLGAVHCCRCEWDEAGEAFNAALSIAPGRTREHSWYAAYLLIIGEEDEAIRLAYARLEERPEDLSAHIALGLFLYNARRFEEAEEVLIGMPEDAPAQWMAEIILALVHLAKNDVGTAGLHLSSVRERLCDPQRHPPEEFDGVFPGPQVLWGLKGDDEGWQRIACEKLRDGCDYALGNFTDPAHNHDQVMYRTPMQVAVGYLGADDPEEAIEALGIAIDRNEPLAALIHRWPFLDPLRSHPKFQALIERMNLP